MLLRAGLAEVEATPDGLMYRASERGPGFVEILTAPYMVELRSRARWLVREHGAPEVDARSATLAITSRWAREFRSRLPLAGGDHA